MFELEGEVYQISAYDFITDFAMVKHLKSGLRKFFAVSDLMATARPLTQEQAPWNSKCECGAETVYGSETPFHSQWCPKYKKP